MLVYSFLGLKYTPRGYIIFKESEALSDYGRDYERKERMLLS